MQPGQAAAITLVGLVFTLSPGFRGIIDGAITSQATPNEVSNRCSS
jgi:hypothetical protein